MSVNCIDNKNENLLNSKLLANTKTSLFNLQKT